MLEGKHNQVLIIAFSFVSSCTDPAVVTWGAYLDVLGMEHSEFLIKNIKLGNRADIQYYKIWMRPMTKQVEEAHEQGIYVKFRNWML